MDILFILISAISLIISFFNLIPSNFDFSWIAIILCGLPILKGATIGLVKDHYLYCYK